MIPIVLSNHPKTRREEVAGDQVGAIEQIKALHANVALNDLPKDIYNQEPSEAIRFAAQKTSSLTSNKTTLDSNADEASSIYGGTNKTTNAMTGSSTWSAEFQAFLDRPPSSFPYRLVVGGIAFCLAFGAWIGFGQVEEVGKAKGQLVPKGEIYKVEPIEMGKVTDIAVKEGEAVKAGQVLVELDTELAKKAVERLEKMLSAYQSELKQKQALLKGARLEAQTFKAIATEDVQAQRWAIAQAREQVATNRNLLTQLSSEAAAIQARKTQLKPLSAVAQKRLEQLHTEEAAHQERLTRLKAMEEEGAVSAEYVFQAEQSQRQVQQQVVQSQLQEIANTHEQLFQSEQSLRDIQTRMTQSQGELSALLKEAERLQAELNQKQAEGHKMLLEAQQQIQQLEVEITQLKAKITETENQLASEQAKLKQRFFRAPVDGIILRLNLKNAGETVQPGETIAEIAPRGVPLVLSATLPDEEAGFVQEGMPVKVKFDAYPYQDYGVISGKVNSISSDAEQNEQLGTVYRVKVELERDYVNEGKRTIKLKAGQAASADIIIRRRRLADILFDPIRQLQRNGIDL